MNDTLIKLVNPEFEVEFMGKNFKVRKASLEKVIQYRIRSADYIKSGDTAADHKILAYCIYLVLSSVDHEITEQQVLDNTPGDLDIIETLTQFGFINPRKMGLAKEIQKATAERLITERPSPTSPKEPDGTPAP